WAVIGTTTMWVAPGIRSARCGSAACRHPAWCRRVIVRRRQRPPATDRLVASGRTCRKFGRQALTRQGNPAFGRPTPNAQQRP
ncbi:MAG: hypothetical protein WCQ21_38620, partial [Verrucomicrobiota bacterium]